MRTTQGPSGRRLPSRARARAESVAVAETPKIHLTMDFDTLVSETSPKNPNKTESSPSSTSSFIGFPSNYQVLEGTIPGFTFSNKASNSKILSDQLQKVDRLWQLKGKKRVKSLQVEKSYKSLNSGDVFILETRTFFHL
jgi:hypothetical protein